MKLKNPFSMPIRKDSLKLISREDWYMLMSGIRSVAPCVVVVDPCADRLEPRSSEGEGRKERLVHTVLRTRLIRNPSCNVDVFLLPGVFLKAQAA